MAEWLIAITAIVSTVVTVVIALVRTARTRGAQESRINAMEEALSRHEKDHAEHYQQAKDAVKETDSHFRDTTVHWNARERDALTEALAQIRTGFEHLAAIVERWKHE